MASTTLWHLFCKVIDNYGDIGVCWRLACDLATRGDPVRLWVDDASALAWMAPAGHAGVQVLAWLPTSVLPALPLSSLSPFEPTPISSPPSLLPSLTNSLPASNPENFQFISDNNVVIESFGCEINPEYIAILIDNTRPNIRKKINWINLEYISAEPYVEKTHGLPSPVQSGPGAGLTKHFFYPGFTPRTGGLLREPDLLKRQASFDRAAWLAQRGIQWRGERLVSLFCYEPAALGDLLAQLAQSEDASIGSTPVKLLVTHGRARQAVEAWMTGRTGRSSLPWIRGQLSFVYLPALTQLQYDELLWACDLNFVRGEDSLVRAIWAGKPFVWHIYPQDDNAHHAKLDAFLQVLGADESLTAFHHRWNGMASHSQAEHAQAEDAPAPNTPSARLPALNLEKWGEIATQARRRWLSQTDLTTQLCEFVAKKR